MPKAKTDEARILDLLRRNPQGLKLPEIFKELRVDRKSRAKIEERLSGLVHRKLARRVKDRWLLPLGGRPSQGPVSDGRPRIRLRDPRKRRG